MDGTYPPAHLDKFARAFIANGSCVSLDGSNLDVAELRWPTARRFVLSPLWRAESVRPSRRLATCECWATARIMFSSRFPGNPDATGEITIFQDRPAAAKGMLIAWRTMCSGDQLCQERVQRGAQLAVDGPRSVPVWVVLEPLTVRRLPQGVTQLASRPARQTWCARHASAIRLERHRDVEELLSTGDDDSRSRGPATEKYGDPVLRAGTTRAGARISRRICAVRIDRLRSERRAAIWMRQEFFQRTY